MEAEYETLGTNDLQWKCETEWGKKDQAQPMKKVKVNQAALLILDMINRFDYPESSKIIQPAMTAAKQILKLKKRFKATGRPVIYVNDNFGRWRADWRQLYASCTEDGSKGREIAKLLRPDDDDYFVLKPKHSGFFMTPLELLLEHLNVRKVVITGVVGNICVLFTAQDAHMREFEVVVPKDCIASNSVTDNRFVIHQLEKSLKLSVMPSKKVN